MNGSPSVRVALFIRESGSESPCRWFYVTGIYNAEQSDLLFIVSDDGVGIPHEQLENIRTSLDDENDTVHGIGLKNIHRRIRLYYGDNYGIVINSSPGRGTSVTVRIPNTLPIQEEQHD